MASHPPNLTDVPLRKGFIPVFRRELHIMAHSRFCTLFIFVLPLVTFVIMGAVFYQETPRDMPILICDNDNTALSRQLTRMADASAALSVAAHVADMEDGAARIRRGEAYAIFYIPAGFARDAGRAQAPAVSVFYNNQWLLTSGVISRAVREIVLTLSAGAELRTRMMKGETPQQAAEKFEPIRLDQHTLFNPNLNYRFFLLPALLPTLMQVFVLVMTVRAIGTELRYGTAAQWYAVSGGRPWVALLGKILPYTICYLVMCFFMLALLVRVFGVELRGSYWLLFAATVAFVFAYQSMGFFFITLTSNLRAANSLSGFYSGPAFAVAGITFPYVGMPVPAKIWASILPLTHYLRIVFQQTLRGAPVATSYHEFLILALFVLLPPALLLPKLGRIMQDPASWGRL